MYCYLQLKLITTEFGKNLFLMKYQVTEFLLLKTDNSNLDYFRFDTVKR